MGKGIFAVFVITLALFHGSDCWCLECPDLLNFLKQGVKSCTCQNAYYDRSTERCVSYFDCSTFKSFQEPDIVNSLATKSTDAVVSSLVTFIADRLAEKNLDIIMPNSSTVIQGLKESSVLSNNTDSHLMNATSKDFDILLTIAKERLKNVNHKYASDISPIFNPYILRNKNLLKRCNYTQACVMKKIAMRNQKHVTNVTAAVLPDIIDQLILGLDDVSDYYAKNCKYEKCMLLKNVVDYQSLITKTLLDMKPYSHVISKNVVNSVLDFDESQNGEILNTIIAKFLVSRI